MLNLAMNVAKTFEAKIFGLQTENAFRFLIKKLRSTTNFA